MKIGKIIRSRNTYRVEGIIVDAHSKVQPKADFYCEYTTKRIVPKNGNRPFDVANISRLVPSIIGLGDKHVLGNKYILVADPTDTCSVKCDGDYNGYRYIPFTENNIKWVKDNCFNYSLFDVEIQRILNSLSK